jgi:DNA-binding NarL/FixJ family response regulator
VAAVRSQLSVPAFDAAWMRGRGLQQAEVLALVQAVDVRPAYATAPFGAGPATLAELTPREKEVLQLVAAGLSNADIAQRLVISQHTVNAHLRTIYDKLGVHSRSAATRLALEHGLT